MLFNEFKRKFTLSIPEDVPLWNRDHFQDDCSTKLLESIVFFFTVLGKVTFPRTLAPNEPYLYLL